MADLTEFLDQTTEMFEWLDALRTSGAVNMYAAPPLLAEAFEIDKSQAKSVWTGWTQTFREDANPEDRAREWLKNA